MIYVFHFFNISYKCNFNWLKSIVLLWMKSFRWLKYRLGAKLTRFWNCSSNQPHDCRKSTWDCLLHWSRSFDSMSRPRNQSRCLRHHDHRIHRFYSSSASASCQPPRPLPLTLFVSVSASTVQLLLLPFPPHSEEHLEWNYGLQGRYPVYTEWHT